MYNPKEKNKHFRTLLATEHAEKDLQLLEELDPRNEQLASFKVSTPRFTEQILYALLDIATAQQIREHRRDVSLEEEAKEENPEDENESTETEETEETEELKEVQAVEEVTEEDPELVNTNHPVDSNNMVESVSEPVEASIEDFPKPTPEEMREPSEVQKKSEPKKEVVKADKKPSPSKKKPSTPTSNGKTSKTKTSK